MRTITVTLYVNDGQGTPGASSAISAKLADMGDISWSIDEQLTKVTPGDLTLKVWDEDGVVWTWFETQIGTTVFGTPQMFPPWLVVSDATSILFIGFIDPATLRRDLKDMTIEISAKDWSVMLRDLVLEGDSWKRPRPQVISNRLTATYSAYAWAFWGVYWSGDEVICFAAPFTGLQAGDKVTTDKSGAAVFTVSEVFSTPDSAQIAVRLSGWSNAAYLGATGPGIDQRTLSVTRVAQVSLGIEQDYYTVMGNYTEDEFRVKLDTLDYLTVGDELKTPSDSTLKIIDLDTERSEIILENPVGGDIVDGVRLYLTEDSREVLVWQNSGDLIRRALVPFSVDVSGIVPVPLDIPILSWLPLENAGVRIRGAQDIEATLAGTVRVLGSNSTAYTGTPETGWVSSPLSTRFVNWTGQLSTPPAYLMPDTTPSDAPDMGSRNRFLSDWKDVSPRYVDGSWAPLTDPIYYPAKAYPDSVVCFDYTKLRRVVINNTVSPAGLSEYRWNGVSGSWGAGIPGVWPISSWKIVSVAPMIGVLATSGVSPYGLALIALCYNNGAYELQLAFAGALQRLPVPSSMRGAKLVTTSGGVWIVGEGGYGKVTTNGVSLSLAWGSVGNLGVKLIPSTFASPNGADIVCLALAAYMNDEGGPVTELHLFHLRLTPVIDENPVVRSEKILATQPSVIVAIKDPGANRVLGIAGGRMFQVSYLLPTTIERVRAIGMTGGELVEHVAQAVNCIVVPRPDGKLYLKSRAQTGAATAVVVDRSKVSQQRVTEYFFSVVRVSGADDESYADAYGPVNGGRVLEVDSQPCVWTEGGCFAMATAYAEFFGIPRRQENQTWFFDNANAAPPWESLSPWQIVTVSGSSREWFLMALSTNLVKGSAEVKLLEKV